MKINCSLKSNIYSIIVFIKADKIFENIYDLNIKRFQFFFIFFLLICISHSSAPMNLFSFRFAFFFKNSTEITKENSQSFAAIKFLRLKSFFHRPIIRWKISKWKIWWKCYLIRFKRSKVIVLWVITLFDWTANFNSFSNFYLFVWLKTDLSTPLTANGLFI